MKVRDALRALDIPVGFYSQRDRAAVEAAVRRQYRAKMLDDHPDRGGDNNAAQMLNEALRVILHDLDGLSGQDEKRHKDRVLDRRQWASGYTGTGRSFDHCIWCLKKMRRHTGSVGWCVSTGNYNESTGEWSSNLVTAPYPHKGFNGNGVFCKKQCAVNYAIEQTCDLVDPYPRPVKIKWPHGMLPGTFEWNSVGYAPASYHAKHRDHVRTDSQMRRMRTPEPNDINWHPETRERLEAEAVISFPEDKAGG